MSQAFLSRLQGGDFNVAVVGLGYVGLPLAVEFAQAGINTLGVDISQEKIGRLNDAVSYIPDVPTERLAPLVKAGALSGTDDFSALRQRDVVCICVPTPLNKTKDPDVSMIMSVAEAMCPHLKKDTLVVLESTTYPGFTREVLVPYIEEHTSLKVGVDVFVCFSPERVDPGNPKYHTHNTPKIIGGMTESCTAALHAVYSKVIEHLVPVSSCDCAEMVKLLENTFRSVNIGLVNEVAIMCRKLGLDTWEVIGAAATKPFGFMPFYPGPGLGGRCIPIDPHYLSWKLKTLKYNARFIELAGEINSGMPEYVVHLTSQALNERRKCLNGSRVLVLGASYKRDIDDMRESPSLDIIELLKGQGAEAEYHDPYVPSLVIGEHTYTSQPIDAAALGGYDAVIISTDHTSVDYGHVVAHAQLIVDSRNATGKAGISDKKIIKL